MILGVLAALPTATPTTADLTARLRMPADELAPALEVLERRGLVERWHDPERPGAVRVMLSAFAARRLGLALAPTGDRWQVRPS